MSTINLKLLTFYYLKRVIACFVCQKRYLILILSTYLSKIETSKYLIQITTKILFNSQLSSVEYANIHAVVVLSYSDCHKPICLLKLKPNNAFQNKIWRLKWYWTHFKHSFPVKYCVPLKMHALIVFSGCPNWNLKSNRLFSKASECTWRNSLSDSS